MIGVQTELELKTKSSQPLMGTTHESHQENKKDVLEVEQATTTLVSNGCVDYKGNVADKRTTGGWKASPFIIVNEVAERLAFYSIAVNMVLYLVTEMHQSIPDAATHVTDWVGAAFILTILGAFMADAYLGRFKTIIIFSGIYAVVLRRHTQNRFQQKSFNEKSLCSTNGSKSNKTVINGAGAGSSQTTDGFDCNCRRNGVIYIGACKRELDIVIGQDSECYLTNLVLGWNSFIHRGCWAIFCVLSAGQERDNIGFGIVCLQGCPSEACVEDKLQELLKGYDQLLNLVLDEAIEFL